MEAVLPQANRGRNSEVTGLRPKRRACPVRPRPHRESVSGRRQSLAGADTDDWLRSVFATVTCSGNRFALTQSALPPGGEVTRADHPRSWPSVKSALSRGLAIDKTCLTTNPLPSCLSCKGCPLPFQSPNPGKTKTASVLGIFLYRHWASYGQSPERGERNIPPGGDGEQQCQYKKQKCSRAKRQEGQFPIPAKRWVAPAV